MPQRLSKLLYVHEGDPGPIGETLDTAQGTLRFPVEGSGVFDIGHEALTRGSAARLVAVKVGVASRDELPPEVAEVVSSQIPCIVGFADDEVAVLLNSASLARSLASESDLRGKIRYAIARVGWELE